MVYQQTQMLTYNHHRKYPQKHPVHHHGDKLPILLDFLRIFLLLCTLSNIFHSLHGPYQLGAVFYGGARLPIEYAGDDLSSSSLCLVSSFSLFSLAVLGSTKSFAQSSVAPFLYPWILHWDLSEGTLTAWTFLKN